MGNTRFALSWDAYKKNICNGLSSLQQNGEFVDMTLAADGHMVKVHQVIIALASPYIKDLIASVQCPHPIIFLNGISYSTLCSMLEYIYTGEVVVSSDDLKQLIDAGRVLRIKGLEDMRIGHTEATSNHETPVNYESGMQAKNEEEEEEEVAYFEIHNNLKRTLLHKKKIDLDNTTDIILNTTSEIARQEEESYMECLEEEDMEGSTLETTDQIQNIIDGDTPIMQYTVSNQGSLQMILNRYMYYLKHTNLNNSRQWRCVEYVTASKCPAHVVTKDDVVLQRINAHVHPFHDKRILKKVHTGAVFSAIHEAEEQGQSRKKRAKFD